MVYNLASYQGMGCLSENFLHDHSTLLGKIQDYSGKKLSSRFPVGLTSADLETPRLLHTGGDCFGSADVCEVVLGEKVEGQRKHPGI